MLTTIVGGFLTLLGTVFGAWFTRNQQQAQWEKEQEADRKRTAAAQAEKWLEARRLAAVTYVQHIDEHIEATRAYWQAFDDSEPRVALEIAEGSYLSTWRTLSSNSASFQLATTSALSKEGANLYNAVRDYSEAVDRLVRGRRNARTEAVTAQDAVFKARLSFISTAQDDLAPGPIERSAPAQAGDSQSLATSA